LLATSGQRSPASSETPGVEIRIKHKTNAPMHLKSYQTDGKLLRTGAANFSASGLKMQDNDLIVIESAGAAAVFKQTFKARFASGEPLPIGPGQDSNFKHY
jgi:phosphatidylserine/phosphatidylglycerophosphate/cardiolipin synthase-like enzyme